MTTGSLPALVFPPAVLPKAAAEQTNVQAYERGLLELARVHHPSVTWWHGYRKLEDGFGSLCYVCDEVIARWDRFLPITDQARREIHQHKMSHRAGNPPAGTVSSRGKAPQ